MPERQPDPPVHLPGVGPRLAGADVPAPQLLDAAAQAAAVSTTST